MIELMMSLLIDRVNKNTKNTKNSKTKEECRKTELKISRIRNSLNNAKSVKDCVLILRVILYIMNIYKMISLREYINFAWKVDNHETYEEIIESIDITNNILYEYETMTTENVFIISHL